MAYSDYGAYVWCNEENISKRCTDTHYVWNGKRFVKDLEDYSEDSIIASGHAVLCFDNFCIEFYKLNEPKIVYSNGKTETLNVFGIKDYINETIGLKVVGFHLGYNNNINEFHIKYKNKIYCVICGTQLGNGLDDTPKSKYLLKHVYYDKEAKHHFIEDYDVDIAIILDKLDRKYDISMTRYWVRVYLKAFFRDLFARNFNGCSWDWDEMIKHKRKIKWLK